MNYWLVKTEPDTFSWADMLKQGTSMWDGVRNYQARNNLRKMKAGDTVFIYYSGKNPGIIGLAKIMKEHYRDPTSKEGDWSAVDISPVRMLNRFIPLQEIKEHPKLTNMFLVKNTRLSVQPLSSEEYELVMGLETMAPI
jgi:predicted RNA-binding protein with PUA-like domain